MQTFFFNDMPMIDFSVELYLGNALIQKDTQTMLIPFAIQQCNQLLNQIISDPRPLRIIIKAPYFTESGKQLINSVDFANNVYAKEFGLDKESE